MGMEVEKNKDSNNYFMNESAIKSVPSWDALVNVDVYDRIWYIIVVVAPILATERGCVHFAGIFYFFCAGKYGCLLYLQIDRRR